ncbi:uncharacterized protein [Musca autumnalis]|uniref:uncharacterized protein n=1 Tax=Musca autumnalis TaxID=221902 RepID=UPI003CE877D3
MESYKAINKKLVEETQTMRKTLAEYQTEIVHLRVKSTEVEINYNRRSTQAASILKNFFTEQLKILDPQSSLLENNRRRSTLLAEEARRSSSVTQTPRSFNSTSPVLSSSTDDVTDVEDVLEAMERNRNINDGNMRVIVEEEENDANLETEEESNNEMSHRDISEYMAQAASILKNFFTEQLKILDPQSSLLENNRRRSTLLAEEARRSSSVIQTPRSFNSTSPVRSSSTDDVTDVEEVLEAMERNRNINDGNMRVIVEETEEESNNEMSHRDISEYMANMSLAYRTDTTEDTDTDDENELIPARQTDTGQRTLRDVTNTHISTTNEAATSSKRVQFVTVARGGRCRENTATQNNIGNDSDVDELQQLTRSGKVYSVSTQNNIGNDSDVDELQHLTRSGKVYSVSTQNNIGNDSDVDELRHLTRSGKVYSLSSSFPLCQNSTANEQTASHSQDISMETIENFHEGNSSTPNSKENTSRRPPRRCKPKSLKEISLQVRLRRT